MQQFLNIIFPINRLQLAHKLTIEIIPRNWISANTTYLKLLFSMFFHGLQNYFIEMFLSFIFFSPKFMFLQTWHVRYSCSSDLLAFQLVRSEMLVHRGRDDGCWQEVGCQDPFLNAASQEGNIPSTAQHHHFFPISRPNALCPTLPPPSRRSAQGQLMILETERLQSWNYRSLETRGLSGAPQSGTDSGATWVGWAEVITLVKPLHNANASLA